MPQKIPRYVDVAVPLPVRMPFTYSVPESLDGSDEPGARAVVPIGRRILTGVILGPASGLPGDPSRIKGVLQLPDAAPIIPSDLLALALWAARYYVAPPGAMIAATLPPGIGRSSEVMVTRAEKSGEANSQAAGEAERRVLDLIPSAGQIPLRRLKAHASALRRMEAAGLVKLETVLRGARVRQRFTRVLRAATADLDAALARCARAPRQQEVLRLLARQGETGIAVEEVYDRLGRVGPAVKGLLARRLIRADRVETLRAPDVLASSGADAAVGQRRLTPEQAAALAEITEALESGANRTFLLMGVTGSGKTEVYLRAIQRCLASGRDTLYLVPEITLTPLLARELKARLGRELAILHSSLSPGERFDEWRRARQGNARIVLGARSAVLAPLRRVGLIVVDEEQDASYKQEEDPRYNARDLALVRGRESDATVILGSATPSVESFHAAASGRGGLLRLPSRIHARPMARVRTIDMREDLIRTGREEVVSGPLRQAVAERLERGEQAIILLNRRGYAPFVLCRRCGSTERCRRCSVALAYHRAADRIRCHYCGYQRGLPSACSTCGSKKIALVGAGTEKLEEQMREIFPRARLARLDRDTARGRRAPAEILSAFERGEHNLLVGTQMVAKGHDFPGVTIVGVIGADAVLAMPDFRAAERTFQLLTQVAGRSGRGSEPGEVIVQAYHCEHYAIQAAARQDYAAFYEKEIRFRRIMKYPPFVVMANLVIQASSHEAGVRRARLVGEVLREAQVDGMEIIGPTVAPISRLKGRYRFQVLVKASSRRRLSDILNQAAAELASRGLSSSRDLVIDMDPVTLM